MVDTREASLYPRPRLLPLLLEELVEAAFVVVDAAAAVVVIAA
jgi:hypothetical protein